MSISKGYIPVGQRDEGVKSPSAAEIEKERRLRNGIQKEDGGSEGGESGAGTVFTSADVYTTTHGGGGSQKRKIKHQAGPARVDRFLDNGTPKVFSKELTALENFLEKSAFPSDNFESQNRMNNPKRLNWKKKDDDTDHAVGHDDLPEGQFYKEDPPAYVEHTKDVKDKEKYASYTLAQQKDMENKIRNLNIDKSDGYGMAGQNDDLHRTDDKDKIPRKLNTNNKDGDDEDEHNWWVVEKAILQKAIRGY
jgi:hypothetical protein